MNNCTDKQVAIVFLLPTIILGCSFASPLAGSLRVCPENPRYFADARGRVVLRALCAAVSSRGALAQRMEDRSQLLVQACVGVLVAAVSGRHRGDVSF